MIPAYEGKEPYIFVSYAHKDSAAVFRLIEELSTRGYRIWYDEGIEPGSEWPEYIANHLIGSEMVLSILTPNAVNSVNCRREINFALSKNKPLLAIYLENIEIPAGLELQLSSQQSVFRYNYDSVDRFLDKVETCQHLHPCKQTEIRPKVPAASVTPDAPYSRSGIKPVHIALIAAACVTVLVIFLLANSGRKADSQQDDSGAVAVQDDSGTDAVQNDSGSDAAGDNSGTVAVQNDSGSDAAGDNSGTVAVQNDSGSWDYTTSRTEESTTYSFARGPRIVLPASWGSQVVVIDEGDMVAFYHTASRDAWTAEGYENAGYLFKLGLDPTQEYKTLPSYLDLGKTSEGYFYLMFPTDLQAYTDNERIMNSYMTLYGELDYVKINSYMAE